MVPDPFDSEIELAEERRSLKVKCAWHPKFFGSELTMREATPGYEKDGVSHGICGECRERIRKESGV